MPNSSVSRRSVLKLSALTLGAGSLSGCAAQLPQTRVPTLPTDYSKTTEFSISGDEVTFNPETHPPEDAELYLALTNYPDKQIQTTIGPQNPHAEGGLTFTIPPAQRPDNSFGCYALLNIAGRTKPRLFCELPPLATGSGGALHHAPDFTTPDPKTFQSPFRDDLGGRYRLRWRLSTLSHEKIPRFALSISKTDYFQSLQRGPALHPTIIDAAKDNPYVERLAQKLEAESKNLTYPRSEVLKAATKFVQKIEYQTDEDTHDIPDYPSFATAYLVRGAGDCEDSSALLSGLLEYLGFRTAVFFFPGHAGIGVHADDIPDTMSTAHPEWAADWTTITLNGVEYRYLETTTTAAQTSYDEVASLPERTAAAYDGSWTTYPGNIKDTGIYILRNRRFPTPPYE